MFRRFPKGFGIHQARGAVAALEYTKTLRKLTQKPIHQSPPTSKTKLDPHGGQNRPSRRPIHCSFPGVFWYTPRPRRRHGIGVYKSPPGNGQQNYTLKGPGVCRVALELPQVLSFSQSRLVPKAVTEGFASALSSKMNIIATNATTKPQPSNHTEHR